MDHAHPCGTPRAAPGAIPSGAVDHHPATDTPAHHGTPTTDGDQPLSEAAAAAHVHATCCVTGPPGRTGVELEWLVHDHHDPTRPVPFERLRDALRPLHHHGLPGGGRLSHEPGGQLELSSRPAPTLTGCLAATAADVAVLRRTLHTAGLVLHGCGLDQRRHPARVLHHPRYRAMEKYFDRLGPWGRVMMRGTAAVQVSLEAGEEDDGPRGHRDRWRLAHRLGPVLVAAFANSPLWYGRPTGWMSFRQAVWARSDPRRALPPPPAPDHRAAWAHHALDTPLLCLRRHPPAAWTAPPQLSFRSWLRGQAPVGRRPTRADLDYHLSTLFPPVRPRGWLELRMIDAQRDDDWQVALTVAATLLDDPLAAEVAHRATAPLCPRGRHPHTAVPPPGLWLRAARYGPADPALGRAARACFTAVEDALARRHAPQTLRDAVTTFAERYPRRGRCPAHDHLDVLPGRAPATPPHPSPRRPTTEQGARR